MKFLVDAMLGKLSRFLRIFGFDTIYANDLIAYYHIDPVPDEKLKLYAEKYDRIIKGLDAYFDGFAGKLDDIAKLATISAILKINFQYMFFVGFYRVDKSRWDKEKVLKIGPYQGESIAISEIVYSSTFGRGVCAKSALGKETINVPDVSKFCGYLACDNDTKSEIVVPVIRDGELIAVLDIDSNELDSFDKVDEFYLEYLC